MRHTLIPSALILALAPAVAGQSAALQAGKVITLDGEPIENGVVVIQDGRITAVGGPDTEIPMDVLLHEYPDGVIFPGFLVAHTSGGLDRPNENVPVAPFLDVRDSIDPVSFYFEDELREGVVALGVIPGNNTVIGGRGRVVSPHGMTVEEMTVDPAMGMKVAMGPRPRWSRSAQMAELREALEGLRERLRIKGQELLDAQARREDLTRVGEEPDDEPRPGGFVTYGEDFPGKSLISEEDVAETDRALVSLLNGSERVWLWCPEPVDVVHGKAWADEQQLLDKSVFVVTASAWKAADILAAAGRPVVLTGDLFHEERDPVTWEERRTFAPRVFAEKGILFAVTPVEGRMGPDRLSYQAAVCVREGLSVRQALEAVTVNAAAAWDLGDRLGRLKPGFEGTCVVLSGDPLAAGTKVLEVWLRGRRSYERSADERLQRLLEGEEQ